MSSKKANNYFQRLGQLVAERRTKSELGTGHQYGCNKKNRGQREEKVAIDKLYALRTYVTGNAESDCCDNLVNTSLVCMTHCIKAREVGSHLAFPTQGKETKVILLV